ncbi:MAG: fimbria/pilus periplasmic chaperone [Idiomarina sp.]|nr:fimbria/pilus periplasmic chaperone [Idiomarina sp.]
MLWPVRPVIDAGSDATPLWLENRSDKPLTLQIRVLDWEHGEHGQRYALQSAVISSPPLVKLAPGERQLVRLYNRVPVASGQEKSWRVLIDEIPDRTEESSDSDSGVRFQVRYSLPLFAYGPGAINPASLSSTALRDLVASNVSWNIANYEGKPHLYITNHSSFNWRIDSLTIHGKNSGSTRIGEGLQGYLLPSATRNWEIPEQEERIQAISFKVNGTEIRVEL